MKRTTVLLPNSLYALLERERRERDVSASAVIREALERYLTEDRSPRQFSFIGIGRSEGEDAGNIAARMEELLDEEYGSEEGYNRVMYGHPDGPLPEQVLARERYVEPSPDQPATHDPTDVA